MPLVTVVVTPGGAYRGRGRRGAGGRAAGPVLVMPTSRSRTSLRTHADARMAHRTLAATAASGRRRELQTRPSARRPRGVRRTARRRIRSALAGSGTIVYEATDAAGVRHFYAHRGQPGCGTGGPDRRPGRGSAVRAWTSPSRSRLTARGWRWGPAAVRPRVRRLAVHVGGARRPVERRSGPHRRRGRPPRGLGRRGQLAATRSSTRCRVGRTRWTCGPATRDRLGVGRSGAPDRGLDRMTSSHTAAFSADGTQLLFDCGDEPYAGPAAAICEVGTDGTGCGSWRRPTTDRPGRRRRRAAPCRTTSLMAASCSRRPGMARSGGYRRAAAVPERVGPSRSVTGRPASWRTAGSRPSGPAGQGTEGRPTSS